MPWGDWSEVIHPARVHVNLLLVLAFVFVLIVRLIGVQVMVDLLCNVMQSSLQSHTVMIVIGYEC